MYSIRNLGTTAHRVDTTAEVFALLGDLDCHGLQPTDLIVVRDDQHLEELVRGNNHIGIRLHGEPLPTLLAMLDEVDPHMRDGSGVRKPWQMQRRHWNAFCAIGSLAFNLPPCLSTPAYGSRAQHTLPDGTELSGSLDEVLEKILVHRYGFGRSGPQYGNGVDLNMRHEVHVQYALAAGWPVPQEVINDYIAITHRFQYDTELLALLERPFLRGVFTAGALHAVLALYEHKSERRITADNVGDFVKAVAPLSSDATYIQVDDALFTAGLLQPRPLPAAPTGEPVAPLNELASTLAGELHAWRAAQQTKTLDAERKAGQLSMREHAWRIELEKLGGPAAHQSHANKMVRMLQERALEQLLYFLDTPDDQNPVTKKFAKTHFALAVTRLRAAERRNAIFRFCGMDEKAQVKWEKKQATAKTAAKQKRQAAPAAT